MGIKRHNRGMLTPAVLFEKMCHFAFETGFSKLTMDLRLTLNSVPLAFTSVMLELQAYATKLHLHQL